MEELRKIIREEIAKKPKSINEASEAGLYENEIHEDNDKINYAIEKLKESYKKSLSTYASVDHFKHDVDHLVSINKDIAKILKPIAKEMLDDYKIFVFTHRILDKKWYDKIIELLESKLIND